MEILIPVVVTILVLLISTLRKKEVARRPELRECMKAIEREDLSSSGAVESKSVLFVKLTNSYASVTYSVIKGSDKLTIEAVEISISSSNGHSYEAINIYWFNERVQTWYCGKTLLPAMSRRDNFFAQNILYYIRRTLERIHPVPIKIPSVHEMNRAR